MENIIGNVLPLELENETVNIVEHVLPPGFKFCPPDWWLVYRFLIPKILGQEEEKWLIPMVPNLFNLDPRHALSGENRPELLKGEVFFFTEIEEILPKRVNPAGRWEETKVEEIIYNNDQIIGWKHEMIFYVGSSLVESPWVLEEYRVHPAQVPQHLELKAAKTIVCKIYNRNQIEFLI